MVLRGKDYDARFEKLAAGGHYLHGEADLVSLLLADDERRTGPVLDAGCGTGRVAIELARRGIDVVGADVDPVMLATARAKAPELAWVEADLVERWFDSRFALALAAGNVMVFLRPGTAPDVIANLAAALVPGGLLVTGFELGAGLTLDDYDASCSVVGLEPVDRWATWDQRPFEDGRYAVSVHRLVHRG